MARILLFSGADHYTDLWHPFAETSAAVAALLRTERHEVSVRDSRPGSLLDLSRFDLMVINSGRGLEPSPRMSERWGADHAALGSFHASGAPLLGLHTAAATFPDWPQWASILGGRWGEGSFHPEIGTATFHPARSAVGHPVWESLESVVAFDERYSQLEVFAGSEPLMRHEIEGVSHTMGWIVGDNVVYDGLGHDGRSYQSPGRCRLLLNEVRWLLDGCPRPGA